MKARLRVLMVRCRLLRTNEREGGNRSFKRTIFSADWEAAIKAGDRLGEIGGEEVFQFLLSILESKRSEIRNLAALVLREIKDS